ncbi:hypothetical protein EC968_010308 [Mortierella alpina]|nr:hypothetical protein EC968_010308 [Mortierella alpina]
MEDEDPSGILRLAESQRHDQVQVGWGGNCTSDHKFLTHLFPHTPNLLELIINSPKQFSDTSLIALSQSCPALHRLELPGCTKITDKGLSFLLDRCLALTTLVLSNGASQNLTDRSLQQLACTFNHSLRVLNLANASSSSSLTGQNPGLMTIAIWCQNLVSLNISHCNLVTDELLGRLSESLQSLNVAHCLEITDEGLRMLAGACPDLRELDITALSLVTDRGVLEIGQGCKHFRRLVMDDKYGRVTETVLRCFPWGAEVVQRRVMLGWRYSRIF